MFNICVCGVYESTNTTQTTYIYIHQLPQSLHLGPSVPQFSSPFQYGGLKSRNFFLGGRVQGLCSSVSPIDPACRLKPATFSIHITSQPILNFGPLLFHRTLLGGGAGTTACHTISNPFLQLPAAFPRLLCFYLLFFFFSSGPKRRAEDSTSIGFTCSPSASSLIIF